jgi:hypothetical protein
MNNYPESFTEYEKLCFDRIQLNLFVKDTNFKFEIGKRYLLEMLIVQFGHEKVLKYIEDGLLFRVDVGVYEYYGYASTGNKGVKMLPMLIKCFRCGKCCHFEVNGKLRKCRYLVEFGKKSACRIYNQRDRIGKVLYKDEKTTIVCKMRTDVKRNYENCPYNSI